MKCPIFQINFLDNIYINVIYLPESQNLGNLI